MKDALYSGFSGNDKGFGSSTLCQCLGTGINLYLVYHSITLPQSLRPDKKVGAERQQIERVGGPGGPGTHGL